MAYRFLLCIIALVPGALDAQAHDHASPRWWSLGAQVIPVVTHATPADRGRDLTEAYLTQPNLFGSARLGPVSVHVTVNLEGLTLERGELNAGTWGEGYIDRRHPHTYLHEAVVSVGASRGFLGGSLTLGRGFAPFGTDDPMSRPFVKFPANHHLSQVLERLLMIGAVRAGPVGLEFGLINGDEPVNPRSLGTIDRFGDSWTTRLTLRPLEGLELQASHASLESPEQPEGSSLDQRKWDVSLRHEKRGENFAHYLLLEWARSSELSDGTEELAFTSLLGEASIRRGAWQTGVRLERTLRPEEERVGTIFRSPWPHTDEHVLGVTRWLIATANVSHAFSLQGVRLAPVLEVSRQWARLTAGLPFYTPAQL
ncbi:MAG: hypothetical protein ACREMA_16315, partial [Longimicrobiales bacterium]